jgi:hypothetical protein
MRPSPAAETPFRDPPEVIVVQSPRVACDGGGGALGHPSSTCRWGRRGSSNAATVTAASCSTPTSRTTAITEAVWPVDPQRYLAFLAVMAVMAMTPGPANLFSIANGMARGPAAVLSGAIGMNLATLSGSVRRRLDWAR